MAHPTDAEFARQAKDAGKLVSFASKAADDLALVDPSYQDAADLLRQVMTRKGMVEPEQVRLRALFRRLDNLYYPTTITTGGADHWPTKQYAGQDHVSDNITAPYVDIPASLQAVPPIETYVPRDQTPLERINSELRDRFYQAWLEDDECELKDHRACTVKGLYGFTYTKTYWDASKKRPTTQILETPENLYIGWGTSDYAKMDWALYTYGISPTSAADTYGVAVESIVFEGDQFPFVRPLGGTHDDPLGNVWGSSTGAAYAQALDNKNDKRRDNYERLQVEVYDYWYRKPIGQGKVQIWNAIFVGNQMVENAKHAEYDQELPFDIVANSFIPGSPYGRPELYDLEQLIRKKDEVITAGGQMIQSVVGGQMWQWTGPEAGDEVPDNVIPKPGKVTAPGAGNRLEAIQPWLPNLQLEEYIKRIDNELEIASGMNDLLIGKAPAQVLGSSKAISALIANYEARIRIKRLMFYQWRKNRWTKAAKIWENKDKDVRFVIDGHYRIHMEAPELSPRDELEVAQMAVNLANARVWSQERAMLRTGVDLPHSEKSIIREEQTDASLNPAAVQAQLQLIGTAQALGQPLPGGVEGPEQAQNSARQTNPTPSGGQSLNAPENAGVTPTASQTPPPAPQAGPGGYGPGGLRARTALKGGRVTSQIQQQTPL